MPPRPEMAHAQDDEARRPNPLYQPASRLEVYVLIILALATKTLPILAPGAVAFVAGLLP